MKYHQKVSSTYNEMIKQSTLFEFHNACNLITCSAEDLIILKAFADRTKDWMDVESIILRQGKKLDNKYIIDRITPLCELKGSVEIIKKLKNLFATMSSL